MSHLHRLKEFPFFKNFSDKDLEALTGIAFTLTLNPKELLFQEGAEGRDLYVIVEGKGEILVRSKKTGKEHKVAEVESGSVVGEIAWLREARRSATLRAINKMVVYRIDGELLMKEIKKGNPGVSLFLLELLKLESERILYMNRVVIKFLEIQEPTHSDMEKLRDTLLQKLAF